MPFMAGVGSGRPGPQPKGDRRQLTIRLPSDHFAIYEEEARRQGLALTDYLAGSLARCHRLEEPAYLRRTPKARRGDMLPLTGTG